MDEETKPINCRIAMLELDMGHEGMAKLLGVNASRLLDMCLNEENVPHHLEHRVRILLNSHRSYGVRQPIMELVIDLLWYLHRAGGRITLNRMCQEFPFSGQQMKNIEQVEGWVTVVWEPERTGRHAYIYLTAAGYKKLGVHMPPTASHPTDRALSISRMGLDDAHQVFIKGLDKSIAQIAEVLGHLKTMRALAVTNLVPLEEVVAMHEALTNGGGAELLKVTHDPAEQET